MTYPWFKRAVDKELAKLGDKDLKDNSDIGDSR